MASTGIGTLGVTALLLVGCAQIFGFDKNFQQGPGAGGAAGAGGVTGPAGSGGASHGSSTRATSGLGGKEASVTGAGTTGPGGTSMATGLGGSSTTTGLGGAPGTTGTGTAGTTSTASVTSTGTDGCTKASDCPAASECNLPVCAAGQCGQVEAMQGATCNGGACDGNGNCKTANGVPCGGDGQCASNICQESFNGPVVCCSADCSAPCIRCTEGVGTCMNIPIAYIDNTRCPVNANECDGMGHCKGSQGQPCTMNSDCASNNCISNLCQ